LPAKREFFPQCEVVCTYEADVMKEAVLSDEKVVLFGVRPCDAMAVSYLDKVFLDEKFVDPCYQSRRDNSVMISLACKEPGQTCFCTSVGAGPGGKDGADILAFDLGDSLLLETATEKGEAFMTAHSGLFKEPTAEQLEAGKAQVSGAESKLAAIDVAGIADKLRAAFDSEVWDKVAERCIGCGVCTYSCPTCHCFGLCEDSAGSTGKRVRVQDACMFSAFTLEASGHNPRGSCWERMRQRVMHKFCYTVENFGDIFCVGCGRCIDHCPVNMDIRETLAEAVR